MRTAGIILIRKDENTNNISWDPLLGLQKQRNHNTGIFMFIALSEAKLITKV